MTKRSVGVIFCLISALLFSARYISAAIYMSSAILWNSELFAAALEYVGSPLLTFSIISLVAGVFYLIWGEMSEKENSTF